MGGVEVKQQLRAEAQEGDDALVDLVGIGPGDPVVQVGVHLEVGKSVGQGRRHGIGDPPVALAVAGGEDGPVLRYLVFAQAAVQDQLIGGGGHRRGGRGDLVQEEDAAGAVILQVGQEGRNRPLDFVANAKRDAAQVAGLHLRQTDIDHGRPVTGGDLGHHL